MTIYTKTGDRGQTRLIGGPPVAKDDARLEVLGTIDELVAVLGLARAEPLADGVGPLLRRLQDELSAIMAEVALVDPAAGLVRRVESGQVGALEELIDTFQAELPPMGEFLVPGDCRASAALHLARTVCRRAERRLVALARIEEKAVSDDLFAYMNRLGDLLFVLARRCAGT